MSCLMIYTVSGQLDSLLTGMQLACFPAVAVAIAITIASAPATIAVLWSYNKYSRGHYCVFVLVCTGALIAQNELYMLKAFDTKSVAVRHIDNWPCAIEITWPPYHVCSMTKPSRLIPQTNICLHAVHQACSWYVQPITTSSIWTVSLQSFSCQMQL